jgi:RHS repeat-associated protein
MIAATERDVNVGEALLDDASEGLQFKTAAWGTLPNRDFQPGLGRWVEQDPAGYVDGMNAYEFVRGAPLSLTDPSGLQSPTSVPSTQPNSFPPGLNPLPETEPDGIALLDALKKLGFADAKHLMNTKALMEGCKGLY